MIIKQLSVFLENTSGRLAEVTGALAKASINISAFSVADTAEYGLVRLIVNKPELAEKVLACAESIAFHPTPKDRSKSRSRCSRQRARQLPSLDQKPGDADFSLRVN